MSDNTRDAANDMLNLDFRDEMRAPQATHGIDFSEHELLKALSLFDPYGVWSLDIETETVTWSDDVYRIHEMPVGDGTVDLEAGIEAYHPDDRQYIPKVIEEAVTRKSGFRLVLRLKRPRGGYKLVKATGLYRERDDGTPQLVGTFSQFQPANRSIAAIA